MTNYSGRLWVYYSNQIVKMLIILMMFVALHNTYKHCPRLIVARLSMYIQNQHLTE
jgi:hypothetical protein